MAGPQMAVSVAVRSIKLPFTTLVSGQQGIGVVQLSAHAGEKGSTVTLSTEGMGKALLVLPEKIFVPSGKTAASFRFTVARGVSSPQAVRIQARVGQTPLQETDLTLVPVSVGSLQLIPEQLTSGQDATVLVALNQTPDTPVRVQLTCAEPGVVIEPGVATLGTTDPTPLFRITTTHAVKTKTITLTAIANGQSYQKTITLVPSTREGK